MLRYNFLKHKVKEKSSSEMSVKGRKKPLNFTVNDFNH